MPLFCQVLASGSKGNAILVGSAKTRILVDTGLSCKELVRRMDRTPVAARALDAILISHEHQDHTRGVGVLSRRFDLPVYLSRGSLEGLPPEMGKLAGTHLFQPGTGFTLGDLQLHPFSISHDAREPSGFIIEHEGTRLGICTDCGVVTQLVATRLQGCHGLVLEANHDTQLLLDGPYPWHLKQRIRSRHGHLSNTESCELLRAIHHPGLSRIVFAHLSETNNRPELVADAYRLLASEPEWEQVHFAIGTQHDVSAGIELP